MSERNDGGLSVGKVEVEVAVGVLFGGGSPRKRFLRTTSR